MNSEIIVGIIIFLCVFVFVVIIFFSSGISDYIPEQTPIETSTGMFLSSCTNVSCQNNLICDGTNFTCKLPEGEVCNNVYDCATGLICSGICTYPPVGTLDQPCPCDPGFFCKVTPGSLNVCKLGPGSFCNSNSDCLSGNCTNGLCSASPPPIINPTQGLIFTCNETNSCIGGTLCMSSTSPNICSTTTGCSCIFPYNTPNLPVNNSCITGMSNINGECYNNTGLPCGASSNCSSFSCGGSSVMSGYLFNSGAQSNNNFLGSTNTSIQSFFPGPTGLINPYKLFSSSLATTDTIYLVDHNLGLLTINYDVSTKISSSWITLLNYTTSTSTTTRTLIDATLYNESLGQLLVAFKETSSSNTYYTVYILNITTLILTPFNVQSGSGIPGTQYKSTNNNPITISYINSNLQSDVLLVENGTVYVKINGQTKYSTSQIIGGPNNGQTITTAIGPVYFYSNDSGNSYNNIAFVGSFPLTISGSTTILPQVLQFSGAIAGTAFPVDPYNQVIYNVFDYSIWSPGQMTQSSISMLTTSSVDNIVSLLYNGLRTFFPMRITSSFRSVSTANAFYILSPASCT